MARFGPGAPEDKKRDMNGIDWDHVIMLEVWARGVQDACSFEADDVMNSLHTMGEIDTLLGAGAFAGADMFGINNMIATPVPINESRNGVKRVQEVVDFAEWFAPLSEEIIAHVRSKGLMYDQQ
jgi:hypothetical protein